MKGIWKDFEKQEEHLRKICKLGSEKIRRNPKLSIPGGKARIKKITREQQSAFGKLSRKRENAAIKEIESQYDHIFLPQEVCDRIGIKDGCIYFIEVKKKGESLREKQEMMMRFARDNYIVIFK